MGNTTQFGETLDDRRLDRSGSMANVALHLQPKLLVALDSTGGDDLVGNIRVCIRTQELGMLYWLFRSRRDARLIAGAAA
jgi:hypothetical protein